MYCLEWYCLVAVVASSYVGGKSSYGGGGGGRDMVDPIATSPPISRFLEMILSWSRTANGANISLRLDATRKAMERIRKKISARFTA